KPLPPGPPTSPPAARTRIRRAPAHNTPTETMIGSFWQRLRGRSDVDLANGGRGDGPPDLDELWRDFNRKLSGLFGGKGPRPDSGDGGNNFPPDMKSAGIGEGL